MLLRRAVPCSLVYRRAFGVPIALAAGFSASAVAAAAAVAAPAGHAALGPPARACGVERWAVKTLMDPAAGRADDRRARAPGLGAEGEASDPSEDDRRTQRPLPRLRRPRQRQLHHPQGNGDDPRRRFLRLLARATWRRTQWDRVAPGALL